MSLLTTWGYTLTEANGLPDMLTAHEYATFTGRNADGTDRVNAEISAACAAIRNYVGWHLAPAMDCQLKTTVSDRRIIFTGNDMLIQLPARYVTGVSAVVIGDVERADYDVDPNGLIRVYNVGMVERYAHVMVTYTAGLPDSLLYPIKELIAHRVTHSIAVPPGITSEASGGVSVTYNAGWINNTRATALAGDNKELLIPYRILGVF